MWLVQLAASLPGGWEGRWIIALGSAGSSSSKPPTPDGVVQLREPWEGSGSPGAWPNHRYVMRRFLLWRHFCGSGSAAPLAPPVPPASPLSQPRSLLSLTHCSVSVSLSRPVSATSTGEQYFLHISSY